MSVLTARADARHLPLADESVHLIVTSPPYNADIRYDEYHDWLPWEDYWRGLIEPAMRECFRVLAPGGRLCLNMPNVVRTNNPNVKVIRDGYRPDGTARPLRKRQMRGHKTPSGNTWRESLGDWPVMIAGQIWPLLGGIGFLPREQLTWIKGDSLEDIPTNSTAWGTFASATNPVLRATVEPIFIASKGSHSREAGVSDITSSEFKAWTRNAWNVRASGGRMIDHPARFPEELPRRLIKLYSYLGDVILDPFNGSGTTVRTARDCGRHGVGFDLSERYCRQAAGRASQANLFEATADAYDRWEGKG